MSTMQPLTAKVLLGLSLSFIAPFFWTGSAAAARFTPIKCGAVSAKSASSILGVATPVRTSPTPLGCLYIVDGRVHLITSVAPDTKTIERVMGIESGTDRATRWTAISVAGSAGFSQSVVTSVGSGIELVIRKDDDLVGAEVIARVNPRAKAIAVLNVIEKQV